MVATKTPRKTSTPAAAKSAGRVKAPTETAPVVLPVSDKVVEETALPVSEAPVNETVEPPQPEAAPEPVVTAVAEPAVVPKTVAVVAVEPEPAAEPEEPEDAGVAIDEDVEQLASLTEQVIYEAEAIAGEAAHNFQVAFKAVTDAQSAVPALSGINTYLQLRDRTWACVGCGTEHDRDLNAAINIAAEGQRLLTTPGSGESDARGEDTCAAGRSSPAGQPTSTNREPIYHAAKPRSTRLRGMDPRGRVAG